MCSFMSKYARLLFKQKKVAEFGHILIAVGEQG